ncbi:hypothetical protein [Rhodanobacter sp. MP7CTX1]|uniref:hypothetical protein n=1 Tax=Rhodanobacter sp. MP7CTX1 TaxID=2723084 RepID=UPI00160F3FBD|nr:hypothetical protein [Rhodanobacter sp. MP7CTX1]MBB6187573.1 hypothetical protein [Rhodanobacter sp. MP7CTX1]
MSTLLEAADLGGVTLCLVWPAKLTSLTLLHAMANLERIFAKDLRGMRTLLWPGTHSSKAALNGVLADRVQLSVFFRSLWARQNGQTESTACTSSPAFLAALEALNDLHFQHPELPNPSLAELVPTFVFDPRKQLWTTTVEHPLERTLRKVDGPSNRRNLKQKVGQEWGTPERAPGALMVLHHTANKEAWQTALGAPGLRNSGRPEILLLDATHTALQTNYNAVSRIPDFLQASFQNGLSDVGAVIVTDDPKTFFVLRARLLGLKLPPVTKVWLAEAQDSLLSANPVDEAWRADQRSNSNFKVSIVDRDASQVALAFQGLTALTGGEESPAYQALIDACRYILRLSNMPAGYSDLTAASTEAGGADFSSQLNAWTPVSLALKQVLATGELNNARAQLEKGIRRAEELIDDWSDATPMASRLLAEIQKHAVVRRQSISLVLPGKNYVLLVHRFLQRKLGADWPVVEASLEWHTLSSVAETLTEDQKGKHFIFIGMSPDVLRVLLTHPDAPHGTAILVAYRQAESTLKTLEDMKGLEAFKPYRGRIGLLAQELERRLKDVPNPIAIGKLYEMSMTFKFHSDGQLSAGSEQTYYKYELENGGHAYASGWVYRFDLDEDPPFRRAPAGAIHSGDFIFDMSDELRAKIESSLRLNGDGFSSVVDPVRMLLKLYHDDVQTRCDLLFKETKRSFLARAIHAKMIEIDPWAANCSPARVYYWLALKPEGDTRPHASKDEKSFKVFCKALDISDESAKRHWGFIRNARRISQYMGRELVARYAEILFQPESAATYRKVPEEVIRQLQQDALYCVYRVEKVGPPAGHVLA